MSIWVDLWQFEDDDDTDVIDDEPHYRCLGCDRPLTPDEIFSVSIHSRAGWCNGCVSVALLEAAKADEDDLPFADSREVE